MKTDHGTKCGTWIFSRKEKLALKRTKMLYLFSYSPLGELGVAWKELLFEEGKVIWLHTARPWPTVSEDGPGKGAHHLYPVDLGHGSVGPPTVLPSFWFWTFPSPYGWVHTTVAEGGMTGKGFFPIYAPCQLNILWYAGSPLGINDTPAGIFKKTQQIHYRASCSMFRVEAWN